MFNKKEDLTGSKFKDPWPQSDKVVFGFNCSVTNTSNR